MHNDRSRRHDKRCHELVCFKARGSPIPSVTIYYLFTYCASWTIGGVFFFDNIKLQNCLNAEKKDK